MEDVLTPEEHAALTEILAAAGRLNAEEVACGNATFETTLQAQAALHALVAKGYVDATVTDTGPTTYGRSLPEFLTDLE
jgi:hypothetical protein